MSRAVVSIISLLGLALLVAIFGRPNGTSGADEPLQIFDAQEAPLKYRVFATGNLKYSNSLELRPEISGIVKTILVEEGASVQRGQTLIKLDSSALQADLETEKAEQEIKEIELKRIRQECEKVKHDLERKEILHRKGYVTKQAIDAQRHDYRSAQLRVSEQRLRVQQSAARLRRLEISLAQTVIRAPFDGVITTLRATPGQTVLPSNASLPGSVLAEIGDPKSVVVEVDLRESDIPDLEVGMPANIIVSSLPDTVVKGRLMELAFSGRESSGYGGIVFRALLSVDNQEILQRVRPGSSTRVEIDVRSRDRSILVPLQAIHYPDQVTRSSEDMSASIFVLDGEEKVESRNVTLGGKNDLFQEITRGLKRGETVIVGPSERLEQLYDGAVVAAPFEELRYADN